MRAVFLGAVAPLAVLAAPLHAEETVRFSAPADWVVASDFAQAVKKGDPIVLFDRQIRLEDGAVHRFTDLAYDVRNAETLSQLGTIQLSWMPDKGDLTVHRLEILRDGAVIDLLEQGIRPEVIRRETELERRTVNGALTALFKVPGLKVGDVLRIASTSSTRDQALDGEMQAIEGLSAKPARFGFARLRMSWPLEAGLSYGTLGAAPDPKISDAAGYRTLEVALPIAKLEEMPDDAPARFKAPPAIMVGSFDSWADVAAVMAPHYAVADAVAPGSALAQEIERIRAAGKTPLERAALALQVVQDDVNYLLNGMDGGNYLPQSPTETWSLRYGDCKAKSLLLLAMLDRLGIEAEAMLVNSENGDAVPLWQPLPGAFDHVVVRATIDGEDYWLDGTSAGSRLATIREVPSFGYALPLRDTGADLVTLEQRWPDFADRTIRVTYDLTRGVDMPALVNLDVETRGVLAARMAARASETDPRVMLGHAQKFSEDLFDGFVYDADYRFDKASGVGHLSLKGVISEPFAVERDRATLKIYTASTNWAFDPDRGRAAWRDIPYSVGGPMMAAEEATYLLPDGGARAEIKGEGDLAEQIVAGTKFQRSLTLAGGKVHVSDSTSYVPREISAAEIPVQKAAMRAMSSADPEIRITDPVRLWELSDVEVGKRVEGLIGPTDTLIDLWPDQANFLTLRSALNAMGRRYETALADIDGAIELEGSAEAYTTRAQILSQMGRFADAAEAAATAYELTGNLAEGTAYAHALALAGRAGEGLEVLDGLDVSGEDMATVAQIFAEIAGPTERGAEGWDMLSAALKERPGDVSLLNSQCWFMGTWSYRLDDGPALCDRAVKEGSYSAAALDSRALVFHRLGREDEALADLDAALIKEPEQAASRYLRGIIRLSRGDSGGKTDIVEALRLSPDIAARYARYGVEPKR